MCAELNYLRYSSIFFQPILGCIEKNGITPWIFGGYLLLKNCFIDHWLSHSFYIYGGYSSLFSSLVGAAALFALNFINHRDREKRPYWRSAEHQWKATRDHHLLKRRNPKASNERILFSRSNEVFRNAFEFYRVKSENENQFIRLTSKLWNGTKKRQKDLTPCWQETFKIHIHNWPKGAAAAAPTSMMIARYTKKRAGLYPPSHHQRRRRRWERDVICEGPQAFWPTLRCFNIAVET